MFGCLCLARVGKRVGFDSLTTSFPLAWNRDDESNSSVRVLVGDERCVPPLFGH